MKIVSRLIIIASALVAQLIALAQPAKTDPAKAPVPGIELSAVIDGIQPQVVISPDGTRHRLYYSGDPKAGDLFYVTFPSAEQGKWSKPIRVNSVPGSAVAIGNDRGGQIALGRDGAIHIAWNGAKEISIGSEKTDPMLYSRLLPGKGEFEPQRNLMTRSSQLDGGGGIAADSKGNIFVVWHAHPIDSKEKGEVARRVFVAASTDNGATFAAEVPHSDPAAGACGCCGLKAACLPDGDLLILYRAAGQAIHRDMHLMRSRDAGETFTDIKLDDWERNACPMSTASIALAGADAALAWENDGQIRWCIATADPKAPLTIHTLGAKADLCKYPSIAANDRGDIVVAWIQGMRWNTTGTAHWVEINLKDPTERDSGSSTDVPAWSLISASALPNGHFLILR